MGEKSVAAAAYGRGSSVARGPRASLGQSLDEQPKRLELERLWELKSVPEIRFQIFTAVAGRKCERDAKFAKAFRDRVAFLPSKGEIQNGRVKVALGKRERALEIVSRSDRGVSQFVQPVFRHHRDQRLVVYDEYTGHACSFYRLRIRLDGREPAA
jgi:hypothetical protein